MRKVLLFSGLLAALMTGFAAWWRRHPRAGSEWVNRVVDLWLIRQGVIEESQGELGLIEHIGRKSGTVRITPIHPVRTPEGFRIIAPLGAASEWARNVTAAGHCRIQVGEVVHELDEPHLVLPSEIEGLPGTATRVMDWLGFRYLVLREFAEHPGTLETPATPEPMKSAKRSKTLIEVEQTAEAPEPVPVA
jgi:deazaflavin-dependent oxidoreductase (nitroreductase family)